MEKLHILRRFLLKATYQLDLLLLYQDMEARLLPVKESELQASTIPNCVLLVKIDRFKLSLDFPLFKVAGLGTLKWLHNING